MQIPERAQPIFQLPRDWYGRARSFYLLEGALLAPPPVNEEFGILWLVGNPTVSVSFCLLAKMEKSDRQRMGT